MPGLGPTVRRGFILLFLCALIGAQAGSLATEHLHLFCDQHCCVLCHAGPLPFLKTEAAASLSPNLAVTWIAHAVESEDPADILLAAGSSRAPPSEISA